MSIPLTVLGGFLGAGKTTALNGLLREATDRIGVLVNDFGAINVDAALIEAQGGDVMALTNGCVCCALGPDLGDSLARIAGLAPDRIVVEASGVADPWRIAQVARLQRGISLDSVLVLADATAFPDLLSDPWLADTLERQVARADLVAISKSDLATPADRVATEAALRRIRPDVRIVKLAEGWVAGLLSATPAGSRLEADRPDHGFRTWSWPTPPTLDGTRLRAVLGALPPSVLRAKGVVQLEGGGPHLLQLVGARWSLVASRGVPAGLVLIGTPDLPASAALQALFAGTILAPQPSIQET